MKTHYKIFLQVIAIVSMICFYYCNNPENIKPVVEKKISIDSITSSKDDTQKIKADVLMANRQVLTAIKNKDYKHLQRSFTR